MLIWQLQNLKNELKKNFPEVFSKGLGWCTKTKAKFEVKDNVTLVFKPKINVPFAALEPIYKDLEILEKLGVISKIDYSEWAFPTVYIKKEIIKSAYVLIFQQD